MIKSKESIISSPINKGKAFLFSKNIGTLIGLGYPAPTLENFNNSTQSYINSLEVFKNHLPEEQEIQDQPWKMVSLLGPEFCNYKLNNIFLAATQSIPTSEEDASRIFNCLQNQDIDLSRIYVQYYTVQFWKWIGSEIVLFPPDSTLLFLRIWLNTRDFTLLDKKVWKKLLSLPGWSDSQKKEIKNFELRYEFINKNSSCLAYIKEQESVLARKVPFCLKSQKEVQEQYMSQYRLLLKFTESFLKKILDIRRQDLDQQSKMIGAVDTSGGIPIQKISWLIQQMSGSAKKEKFSFELGSWEDRFLNSFKNISYKIFAWRVKKMLPALQTFLKKAVNKLQKVNQELLPFQEIQRRFLEVLDESNAQYSPFKECIKQFDLRNIQLNELEKDISSFELLSQSLLGSFIKQQKEEPTEDQIALIEKNQRELIEEEEKANSSQEKSPSFLVSSDIDREAEEFLQVFPDNQLTNTALLNEPVYSLAEMDAFLESPNQVNGFLSKAINGILKQLKSHLLKIQTDLPSELKALQNKKIYEIHAQLVLATAALEQIIQAIQDQRWNHVVLGFRSTFIHCHFAVEQMLSLEILCKRGKITTTHNLSQLEEEAGISIHKFEQKNAFLRDIAMHLWFCYPGDYRSFYPKSDYPKPFILLERLFHPYKDTSGKNLDVELLAEALQKCFTSYCQTIEFIAQVSSSFSQDLDGFLEKIKEIQQKIQIKIHEKSPSKHLIESSILQKCKQILHTFEKINIPDFEDKYLLEPPLNTIKEYLQLMKLSLESSPESNTHSLQKFLHMEVLANMDKLFKHLFRTIILLQTGEDNHSHNLLMLFQLVEKFYAKDLLKDEDKAILKKINLKITHHYLYKDSHASLQKKYINFFDKSYKLAICSEGYSTHVGKEDVSYQGLEKQKEMIYAELELALNLFHKLLIPLGSEFEELNVFDLKRI